MEVTFTSCKFCIKMLYFPVFLFALIGGTVASGNWGYGKTAGEVYGPADWGHVSKYCDASSQSPVNINCDDDDDDDDNHNHQLKVNFSFGYSEGTFTNNGHSPTLAIKKGSATLTNPINGQRYSLVQFHFHFGCDDSVGSEHTVNGKAYPGEMHLVFFNTKYVDFGTAATKPDGLTVIGVFLTKGYRVNRQLQHMAEKAEQIAVEGAALSNVKVFLTYLVPGLSDGSRDFYSYKGSLTTPGCYESVSWLVLKDPIQADDKVLASFRKLQATHGKHHGKMCDNYRPIQPLNGRVVTLHESD